MNDSILNSIKKFLGLDSDYDAFDTDLIVLINSALMTLNQLGVGIDGYAIAGSESIWSDFLGSRDDLEAVKMYTYLSVRLVFDPPSSGTVVGSYEKLRSEYEWRLKVRGEHSLTI